MGRPGSARVGSPQARSRILGRQAECCFCSQDVNTDATGGLTFVVVAASRMREDDKLTAQYWRHARCLGERLASKVPFDPEGFDD